MARSERSDTRVRAILDAAAHVFARDGVDAASMVQIARAANLSKPALYHYFDGKDALVTALVAQLFDDDAETLARVHVSTAPAATVLRGYASDLAELFARHTYLGPVLAEFCARAVRAAALREVVGGAYERYVAAFETVLARGVASGELDERTDPAGAAFAFVALLEGTALVAQATGRDLSTAIELSVAAFVDALTT